MMGVAQIYGDQATANAIATTGETVGLPWTYDGEKFYVGRVLPVGDIMVAYSHNATVWFGGEGHLPDESAAVSSFWRVPVHCISALLFIPTILFWIRKNDRRQDDATEASP